MIINASSLRLRVVLVRVQSFLFFICFLTDCVLTRPSLFQTKVLWQCGSCSSFLLASLSPKETRKATRASKGSGPRARPGINGLLGFQGCWVFSPARTLSRLPASRLPRKGVRRSRGQGLREDPPDLWPPCVRKHRGTSPEKKINLRTIVSRNLPVWEVRGKYYLGFESKIAGFHLSRSEGAKFGQGI